MTFAAATADGGLLITGAEDGKVRRWQVESGVLLEDPLVHDDRVLAAGESREVTSLAIDAVGTRVASGGSDGRVKLWDLKSGELLKAVQMHGEAVTALAFSPDGATIAGGSERGATRFWGLEKDPELAPPMTHAGHSELLRVNHVVFSPEGDVLAVSGKDNVARLWEVSSGRALGKPMAHIDSSTYGLFLFCHQTTAVSSPRAHTTTRRESGIRTSAR